jgi:Ca2+-binding EF-hand superfamily protein
MQAVGRLGVPMSQQELVAIAKRLDVNADGQIDYYEFSKLIDLEQTEMCVYICVIFLLCRWMW